MPDHKLCLSAIRSAIYLSTGTSETSCSLPITSQAPILKNLFAFVRLTDPSQYLPHSMNRYNNYGLVLQPSSPSSFNQSYKSDRHDERASLSGSEDGNYGLYGDIHKSEADIEGAFTVYPVHELFLTLSP